MNKQTFYKKTIYLAVSLFFLAPFINCATISPISTDNWKDYYKPGRSKEEIAKDFNLYKGKWWNYYSRGRWFAEGGYYNEAIQDFNKALSVRSRDECLARSYGLHFWEYFAHRELGVVYYHQEKYEEARQELKTSLSTADSARAKFYLNKCNEAILKMTQKDQKPPEIKVTSHADGALVNTPLVKLRGTATDDFYVSDISIKDKRLFIELAEKELNFVQEIPLHAGGNVICLEASDLLGKSVRQDFKLILDILPPIIYLDDIKVQQRDGKTIATVQGTIEDDYGIKHLYINNTEIPITPDKKVDFNQDIALADLNKISLKVIDKAGNETRGEQKIGTKAAFLRPKGLLDYDAYACSTNAPVMIAASSMNKHMVKGLFAAHSSIPVQCPSTTSSLQDTEDAAEKEKESSFREDTTGDDIPPEIHTDLKPAVVQDDNLFFSMDVHDDSGVAKLFVNQYALGIRTGKCIFFNYLLPLTAGDNIVTVKAVDTEGNKTQMPPVKITKKTFELMDTDARYTVAWLPLRIFAKRGISSDTFNVLLLKAFDEEPKRFNFVERDPARLLQILQEQKISSTKLASPDTAIKFGKIRAAEGIFFGSVEEDAKGINITLQLIDTETTQILAHADVYDEDKSLKNIEWLMHGLALKMKRHFPLIEGNVIRVSGNGFHIDAGATSGLKLGMKLLMFREIREDGLVLKEPLDTVARIVLLQPETAFAKISKKGTEKIKKKDLVITK